MSRKLKTIYELLEGYSKDMIDREISNLSDDYKRIIFLRYGADLDHPVTNPSFDKKANTIFYNCIIPKMKKQLQKNNPTVLKKEKSISDKNEENVEKIGREDIPLSKKETVSPEDKKSVASPSKTFASKNMVLSKEDYLKALSLLQSPNFLKLLNDFSTLEAVVVCLKLGYIDGKYFETKEVAEFLEIENSRVYDITRKFLEIYKENVLEFIDKIIDGVNDSFTLTKK